MPVEAYCAKPVSRFTTALFVLLFAAGCASTGGEQRAPSAKDPYEGFNRAMYGFNDALDRAILKPVAKGYRTVTPDPVESGIGNFFANLGAPIDILNSLLQGKFGTALSGTGRFLVNSTVGLFGFFDPAAALGLEAHDEDFGQTLAVWGLDSGPYLVLPFLGPSTVRDAVGMVPDYYADPLFYYEDDGEEHVLTALWIIDTRARLLDAEQFLEDAYDPYSFLRDAYLQRREYLIHDGNPPVDYPDYEAYEAFDDHPLPEDDVPAEGDTADAEMDAASGDNDAAERNRGE